MTTKHAPATPLYKYRAGTRLSSAYTAGRDGQPHAKHYGGMESAATKAWLTGSAERQKAERSEQERRANAYPQLLADRAKLVEALHDILASENIVGCPSGLWSAADSYNYRKAERARALLRELGEDA